MALPELMAAGHLPPGIHPATWPEVVKRFAWNERRRLLAAGCRSALESLAAAGCRRAYLDGSFVTDKEVPGDFDACWEPDGVVAALLDPVLLKFDDGRSAQKAKFHGELFPSSWDAQNGGPPFVDFFQTDPATGESKGVISIDLPGGLNDK
jgi:hypothetical protein